MYTVVPNTTSVNKVKGVIVAVFNTHIRSKKLNHHLYKFSHFSRTGGCAEEDHYEMKKPNPSRRLRLEWGSLCENSVCVCVCGGDGWCNIFMYGLVKWIQQVSGLNTSKNKYYSFRIIWWLSSKLSWPSCRSPRGTWKTLTGRRKKLRFSAVHWVSSGSICHNYVVVKGKSRKGLINLI